MNDCESIKPLVHPKKIDFLYRAHGFVLVLFALLLGGFAWALFELTDLARKNQEYSELQHVTDHTAHALAVLAARDLNFKAITNRAMLANEVVIGQLHALLSWFEMAREMSWRTASYSVWIPYVNQVTQGLARLMQSMQPGLQQGLRATVYLQQFVLEGLQTAQWTFHQASWLTSLATAQSIARESHLGAELLLLNHQTLIDIEHLWFRFQSRTSDQAAAEQYIQQVTASRDEFTRNRTYRWFNAGVVYAQKAGGTDPLLRNQRLHWQSIDTLSLHQRVLFLRRESRLGAGSSYLTQPLATRGRPQGFGESYQLNPRASQTGAGRGIPLGNAHPIPEYYRLTETTDDVPSITVVVYVPNQEQDSETKPLWAAARSEVFFQRPQDLWPRKDGRVERANLWNGVWQARHVWMSPMERRMLGALVQPS